MSKIDPTKLLISEHFYSVQGEGISTGVPSYFVRLTNCNLTCGASAKFVNKFKKDEVEFDPGTFKGDLHESGLASWTCDTIPVWTKGHTYEFQELIDSWKTQGLYDDIKNGLIHIIWTGGEPTLPAHQESIVNFVRYWMNLEKIGYIPGFHEIETNGTCYIDTPLKELINQINCSAKLANSGMPKNKRIISGAIERIIEHPKYQFKFVISTEDDVKEIFRDYIFPFHIPLQNVVCMPGLDSQADFFERTKFVMEMAIKYKFIVTTRLHVAAWDKTTGV